jgi:hypothetical protein
MSCDKAHTSIYTENLKKKAKDNVFQYNYYRGRDLNPGTHEYNDGVLTI